jgi:hypothetical protein
VTNLQQCGHTALGPLVCSHVQSAIAGTHLLVEVMCMSVAQGDASMTSQ